MRAPLVKGMRTVPRTADEFVEHYCKSNIWRINQEDMNAYLAEFVSKPQRASAYQDSAWAEHATTSSKKSPYVISIPMQMRAVMVRRLHILKGNMGAQSLVVGTVFLRIQNTAETFFSRDGVLCLSVLSIVSTQSLLILCLLSAILSTTLSSLAEIPTLYAHHPLILHLQKAAMCHPLIEAAAMALVDIPITFATLTVYSFVLYFIVGLQATASQFL